MPCQSLHGCRELVSIYRGEVSFNCDFAVHGRRAREISRSLLALVALLVEHIALPANEPFPRLLESYRAGFS